MSEVFDVIVAGGGIVGLATALALTETEGRSVLVLEAEGQLAAHQSGHNSGVIHAGLYYRPGSLRARLCTEGREALYRFCVDHEVKHDQCGKVVVAVTEEEVERLDDLQQLGSENGLTGLQQLDPDQLREREPHATGRAALLVPQTGIVDFAEVCRAYAKVVEAQGGVIRLGVPVLRVSATGSRVHVTTPAGTVEGRRLINCAGLQADRLARRCGYRPTVRVVPFRGGYDELTPEARGLVRHLIYPVPDPRYPFLGVHFTRTISGAVEVGPTAALSFARHGYREGAFSLKDTLDMMAWPGFWRMGWSHWRTALDERRRSRDRNQSLREMQQLVPELEANQIRPGRTGVRAMAIDRQGRMLDDFRIVRHNRIVHVLNAPSPAATASIAIGRHIANLATDD